MSRPYVMTFADAIQRAVAFLRGGGDSYAQDEIFQAVQSAYMEVWQARNWKYLWTYGRINTVEPYQEGTIEYDAGTRQVTLSGGTWPDWARYGTIRVANVLYNVAEKVSSTVVTLEAAQAPTESIAAGTSYTLFRAIYTLPADFQRVFGFSAEDHWCDLRLVDLREWMRWQRQTRSTGTPTSVAIGPDPDVLGQFAIYLYPAPQAARSIDFMYLRKARPLMISGEAEAHSQGTITANGTTTITGTGTLFSDAMVGSILRIGTGNKVPQSWGSRNPPWDERVIVAVNSPTSITVDANVPAISGVKYVVSDPVDLDESLINYFDAAIKRQLMLHQNREWQELRGLEVLYDSAKRSAFEADNRYDGPRHAGPRDTRVPWVWGFTR